MNTIQKDGFNNGFHKWFNPDMARRTGPVWSDADGSEHYTIAEKGRVQAVRITFEGDILIFGEHLNSKFKGECWKMI